MDESRCWSDWIDCTVDCELPAGHEGDHQGTVTWEQSPPPAPFDPDASPGYAAFLGLRYGGGLLMSSPQTAELVRPRRRWWRRA